MKKLASWLIAAVVLFSATSAQADLSNDPDGFTFNLFGDGVEITPSGFVTVNLGPTDLLNVSNGEVLYTISATDEVWIDLSVTGNVVYPSGKIIFEDLDWGVPGEIVGVTTLLDEIPGGVTTFFGSNFIGFEFEGGRANDDTLFSSHFSYQVSHVPEPSTYAIWGFMGLVGTSLYWMRRKK